MMKKKSTDTEKKKESGQAKHSDNKDNSTNFTDNPGTGKAVTKMIIRQQGNTNC